MTTLLSRNAERHSNKFCKQLISADVSFFLGKSCSRFGKWLSFIFIWTAMSISYRREYKFLSMDFSRHKRRRHAGKISSWFNTPFFNDSYGFFSLIKSQAHSSNMSRFNISTHEAGSLLLSLQNSTHSLVVLNTMHLKRKKRFVEKCIPGQYNDSKKFISLFTTTRSLFLLQVDLIFPAQGFPLKSVKLLFRNEPHTLGLEYAS